MRIVLECVHEVNLRETCPDCERELEEGPTCRAVWAPNVMEQVDRLHANQAPSSLAEALNSGDGSYRP